MVIIRLSRGGVRNKPVYKIVVTDDIRKSTAPPLEVVGFWNPKNKVTEIKKDRVKYWVEKGAQISAAVTKLLA